MKRLDLIKTNEHFLICQACDYIYLPMVSWAKKKCPSCEPRVEELAESDVEYIRNEQIIEEEVTHVDLFDSAPKFSAKEYKDLLEL